MQLEPAYRRHGSDGTGLAGGRPPSESQDLEDAGLGGTRLPSTYTVEGLLLLTNVPDRTDIKAIIESR